MSPVDRAVHVAARHRRGSSIVLLSVLLIVLIFMIVFAVEVGRITVTRGQLQTAVDAGAVAGALQLAVDPTSAQAKAEEFVQANKAGWAGTVPSANITVEMGHWDSVTETFTASANDPMAVSVSANLDNEPFLFARMFRQSFAVSQSAIATAKIEPADIMIVLDLSGSMGSDGRIEALRAAAPEFVDTVDLNSSNSKIGVMGYGVVPSNFNSSSHGNGVPYTFTPGSLYPEDSDWVGVLEASITSNFTSLKTNALSTSSLVSGKYGGGTPIGAAVRDGAHALINDPGARNNVRKIMVLMSDGHANKPEDEDADAYAVNMANYASSLGIIVHTISLGDSADTVLMSNIANAADGSHFVASGTGASVLTPALTEAFKNAAIAISTAVLVD